MNTEQALLGAFLRDNSLVHAYPCRPEEFADRRNGELYRAIRSLVDAGEPADAVTLLDQTSHLDAAALMESYVGSPDNAPAYHRQFKRRSQLRRAQEVGQALMQVEDPAEVEACMGRLLAVTQAEDSHTVTQPEALAAAVAEIEAISKGKKLGYSTGLASLDACLGGLHGGDLVVLGARSQHGKTAMMLNLALGIDEPVGIISGEQPNLQLELRAISIAGGVEHHRFRTGQIGDAEWDGVNRAMHELHDRKLIFDDTAAPGIDHICALARQWAYHHNVKVLFVDYLQLVTGGEGDQHRLQIGSVARRLKALAKSLNICVVALAQVRRDVDARPEGAGLLGRMPWTADLAESAQIEDAADVILTLYRPGVYWPNRRETQGVAYLNVCKNRHGPSKVIELSWLAETMKFRVAA